jgi:hypothetical protein
MYAGALIDGAFNYKPSLEAFFVLGLGRRLFSMAARRDDDLHLG